MAKRLWQAAVEQHAFFRLTFLSLHRNNKYKFCSIILSCGHSSPLCSECSFLTALMLLESQNHSLPKLYIMSQTPPGFSHIFRKRLGIFSPNFTCLLYLLIYAWLQISIQLSATLTKLCRIKCDHLACVSADGGHFKHIYIYTFIRHNGRTLRKKDTQGQKSTMYNYKLIQTTTSYLQKLYQ